ncbi:MAG: NADH-quinone oxidoreductase subunit N [Deltaproteobacteria bacterium]
MDLFSQIIKAILSSGFFLTVCLCSDLRAVPERKNPEFYLLLTLSTLGMMILVSSIDLIIIYLALELSSYSLYILVPLNRDNVIQTEAGIKYFFMGTATSAVMLFGMALIYGSGGETHFPGIINTLAASPSSPMMIIGLLFAMTGFFFKLALFPFHLWAPAVYQSTVNQASAYIATVTKVAAAAMIIRLAGICMHAEYITHFLIILAVTSMTLGNLAAMIQKDFKRLLAYSAVAQAGYILVGIIAMGGRGFASSMFYASAYMLMNYLCFIVAAKVSEDGKNIMISELAGLHSRSPLLALAVMMGVFSLGGIPPTIGFASKLLVFTAAMEKGYFFLVLIAMINVAISLYYYALVVKAAYFTRPETEKRNIEISILLKILIWTIIAVVVIFGIYPTPLYSLFVSAAQLVAG